MSLESEDFGGVLSRLQFAASIDGREVDEAGIDVTNPGALPRAFHFDAPDQNRPLLAVRIEGFLGTDPAEGPVFTRIASTRFVNGQTRRWVVGLDPRCLSGDPYHTFGGPVCVEPQTCIAGRCEDSYTAPQDLFAEGDGGPPWDVCLRGPTDVILGNGASGFAPLHDGDVLQMQKGTQGGHHVWLALRLRGFPQRGTTVHISGGQPDGGASVLAVTFLFALDPDADGYCRLTNLRFQLDAGGTDYHLFLGPPLYVRVDLSGVNGASGSASATVAIASTVASN